MNKKIGLITLILLALPIITAIPVQAGKGQEKIDFELLIQGLPMGGELKEADGNNIWKGRNYNLLGDFYVKIGENGVTEDLSKDYLEYEGTMDYQQHTKLGFINVEVRETIFIYNDPETHDETTLRGTLEIRPIGINKAGQGSTFVGHGTGDFEGVKILGTSSPTTRVDNAESPTGFYIQLIRTGTVMGWPTA